MFVVSLIARPHHLSPASVEAVRHAWGGGEIRWLADAEAAEFDMGHAPDRFRDVWEGLQALKVDLNLVPAEGRRKQMLLADMDSTMIGQECIDELADAAGIGAHVAGITARAMNGELDFEAALTERVGLLKGLDVSVIQQVLDSRITPAPGGRELVATMKARGAYCALVSGGFTAFTRRVAGWFGFDENRANELQEADGKLTGTVAPPILGRQAKVEALDEISAMMGLELSQVMAVGDGANDLGMLRKAGAGVALHAKPVVAAECELRINHADLTALLFLQGYCRDEFVAGAAQSIFN